MKPLKASLKMLLFITTQFHESKVIHRLFVRRISIVVAK